MLLTVDRKNIPLRIGRALAAVKPYQALRIASLPTILCIAQTLGIIPDAYALAAILEGFRWHKNHERLP
jgi:hypothetical protein